MSKQPETLFLGRVQRELKKIPDIWFTKIQAGSIRGIPDILGCINGRFFAWELKVGKNTTTKLQEYTLEKIEEAGGRASVVTPDNLELYLHRLRKLAYE